MKIFEKHGSKILILFFLIAYVAPLAFRPMMRPDEFRYAEIAREMIASGDFTVPHADGFRYFEKPALGCQLIAASCRIFGFNAFAVRLPSALAAGLSALALWILMRTAFPEKRNAASVVVALQLSFALVWGVGTFAVLDSMFSSMVTLAVVSLYLGWLDKDPRRSFGIFVLAGAFAGIAFLIKGFLGPVLPALIGGAFLFWNREWKKLFLYFSAAFFPAAFIVAAPWSMTIWQQEPDFWHYFIVMEHWNRLTGSTYDRKPEPFWYFLPVLLGGILPGGLAVFTAWKAWTKKFFAEPLHLFALLWFALPFLLFSASSCKLPTYILPCFPPLAILLGCGLNETAEKFPQQSEKIARIISRIGGALLILLGLGTAAGIHFTHDLPGAAYAFAFLLLLWGAAALMRQWDRALHLLFLGLLLFCGSVSLPRYALGGMTAGERIRECLAIDPVSRFDLVLADKSMVLPVAWELRRDDIVICGRPGEMRYALENYPTEYRGRQIDEEKAGDFLRSMPRGRTVLFTLRRRSKPLPANWPAPITVIDTGSVVMYRY